jgi:23S rRNA pseudouridine2605 synthase
MVQGRVRVNGAVVTTLGATVNPAEDTVELDGRRVELEAPRWVAYHKPAGVLTTRDDPQGRPTVYDGLPSELATLKYLGRLDMDTEGLLLLSNRGDLMHRLLHPSNRVEREYEAQVVGVPGAETLARLTRGVALADGPARARRARVVRTMGPGALVRLVLLEGRKREVRRLWEAVGHPVRRLVRLRFGPVTLGSLAPGEWRDLTADEVAALEAAAPG